MTEPLNRPQFPTPWYVLAFSVAGLLLVVGVFSGYLTSYLDAVIIGLIGFVLFSFIGVAMSRPADANWLPSVVAAGYLAKLLLSTGRYLVLVEFYDGSGDATGYHGSGLTLVHVWRSFELPPDISIGTSFIEAVTGLLYVPYAPTMIGGFFIYASLAFTGQLLIYAAFRRSTMSRRLKWYALVIFFVPAISYWPSSIGKESLMFLGLGLAAYGASMLLDRGGLVSLLALVAGLSLAGAIRPHLAALLIGSLGVALGLAKTGAGLRISLTRRVVLTLMVVSGSLVGVWFASGQFNIDLTANVVSDVDEFMSTVQDNTSKGGSGVSGSAIKSPMDIPEAAIRVLFRPLVTEAHNAPAMASAIEGTLTLAIVLWRLPWILKNTLHLRKDPYVLMSLMMVFGFVIMFSAFLNLGLLARQRSLILPFLAVVVIQLGWNPSSDGAGETSEAEGTRRPAVVGSVG